MTVAVQCNLVALCDQKGFPRLSDLDLNTMKEHCDVIDDNIYGILGTKKVIQNYQSEGAGGIRQLDVQLKRWNSLLK